MHDRPDAAELLATIAETLEAEVLPVTEGLPQHQVRVAVSLCRILEREVLFGPEVEAREVERLQRLLRSEADELLALNSALDARLAFGVEEAFARAAWRELVAITRDKLRIAKPGHDRYDFGAELLP